MEQNKQLPQVQEILDLLQRARDLSLQSLHRIEKINTYVTQIQGRNMFVQQCLNEQVQMMQLLSEQNPNFVIFQNSKERMGEALNHALGLSQLSERSLEILDLSANEVEQDHIIKASTLLKSVIACLDMITQEKMQDLIQTTANNQSAGNATPQMQDLQNLKNYLKGLK